MSRLGDIMLQLAKEYTPDESFTGERSSETPMNSRHPQQKSHASYMVQSIVLCKVDCLSLFRRYKCFFSDAQPTCYHNCLNFVTE